MGVKEIFNRAKSVEIERTHHTSIKEETHQSDLPGQGAPGLTPPALYEAEKLYGAAGVAVEANAPHGKGYLEDARQEKKQSSSEKLSEHGPAIEVGAVKPTVNNTDASTFDQLEGLSESDKEALNAHRAFKTATWVGVFYLITTAVYQNIVIAIVSMAAIIKYGPYIAGAQASSYGKDYPYNNQPVMTSAFVSYDISTKVNGRRS
ncbi:related to neutral amino acid permease (fragment) [Sporisorium scitamineum]|uniref:Related to neutral amino acid permease n=1 Tax=Sporisorium scitamineum TaxID=49012 RepID=A0A127ZKH9_9BASI